MPTLIDMHWLRLFGALWLGIAAGWLAYLALLPIVRTRIRPAHAAIGAVAIVALFLAAKAAPARYGMRLELGLMLAVAGAIGCFVGYALRALAEFAPVTTRPAAAASSMSRGSYLFRDAFAGMGTQAAYMRATTGSPSPVRDRPVPSNASLAEAPAPGGYTFPETLPFADATRFHGGSKTGVRRHWSWPG